MSERLDAVAAIARRRKLDWILICNQANVRAFTGLNCDNAVVRVASSGKVTVFTDFRYIPMVHRVAPSLRVVDLKRLGNRERGTGNREQGTGNRERGRIGYEDSISHARFLAWKKKFPKAVFVDVSKDLARLRAVKTPAEIEALKAAEKLTCEIWTAAKKKFKAGMTEREMARIIQKMMIEKGDGEAFDTIVSVGANAAECHHEPDDTVWNGRESVLIDMGVKLNGVCSDLTRNIVPKKPRPLYRKVYDLVLSANRAAIAAARPGMTGAALDKVARDVIRKGGFGKCFGHSLGHGVGYEIHEAPSASKKDKTVLKPGMAVTIEPGVYLEGNLGVRIEDLVLITETGCEVLSASAEVSGV